MQASKRFLRSIWPITSLEVGVSGDSLCFRLRLSRLTLKPPHSLESEIMQDEKKPEKASPHAQSLIDVSGSGCDNPNCHSE